MPTSLVAQRFWDCLFEADTPDAILAQALEAGMIEPELARIGAPHWKNAWLQRLARDCFSHRHRAHRPWQLPPVPTPLPARLQDIGADSPAPDGLWIRILDAFARTGQDPFLPLPEDTYGFEALASPDLLDLAVTVNAPAMVDWLVSHPGFPDPKSLDLRRTATPVPGERAPLPWLHAATLCGHTTLVQALLAAGLDPNAPDHQGRSPLFHARAASTVQALLAAGADAAYTDAIGRTARQHWKQIDDRRGLPGGTLKQLEQAMGGAGITSEQRQANVVMDLASRERKFTDPLVVPDIGMPLYAARMNPGGQWKGQWSPAAWMGLRILTGDLHLRHLSHLPELLARADFLSPHDAHPRTGLAEYGLLGLAVCTILGSEPLPKAIAPPGTNATEKHVAEWVRWSLARAMETRFGPKWFAAPCFNQAMVATSATLLASRTASDALCDGLSRAWVHCLAWQRRPPGFTQALRQAVLEGKARMEDKSWEVLVDALPPLHRLAFALRRLGDSFLALERKNKAAAPDWILKHPEHYKALAHVQAIALQDGPSLPAPPDPMRDHALAVARRMVGMEANGMARISALVRHEALDQRLPAAAPGRKPGRM